MWSTLVSPILVVTMTILVSPAFLSGYIVWIMITRLIGTVKLWGYSGDVSMAFPLLLYLNQMLNASVKVYCMFRLSKQRRTNLGDQRAGFGTSLVDSMRNVVACNVTTAAMLGLLLGIISYSDVFQLPTHCTIATLIRSFR